MTATRAPRDIAAPLRAAGLKETGKTAPPARLVSAPRRGEVAFTAPRAPFGQPGTAERAAPPPPPQFGRQHQPAHRQLQPNGVSANTRLEAPPPAKPNVPRSLGPNVRGNAPATRQSRLASPAQTQQQKVAPPQVAPRQAAPRVESPSVSRQRHTAPRMQSPSVSQRRAAAPEPRVTTLPGTPSNQLYRGQPSRAASRPAPQNMVRQNAPAPERLSAPPKHAVPERLSQPRGGGHRVVQ